MANLLVNGNFAAPPLPPTLLIGTGHPGKCAAPNWSTWNNSGPGGACAYTSTAVLNLNHVDRLVAPPPANPQPYCFGVNEFPMVRPQGADAVLEVRTNGDGNGIVQVFAGAPHTMSRVSVFVVLGAACMGTGNGGNTGCDRVSTKNYEWELLEAPNGVSPATEFIVYSKGGGAWFFVANASVVIAG